MAVRTGADADILFYAFDAADAHSIFGSQTSGGSITKGKLNDTRVARWALHTHRVMKNVTPMDSDASKWAPGPGGGVCLLKGWIDTDLGTPAASNPGRYDSAVTGATIVLYFDAATPNLTYRYQFEGRVEMFNVVAPVDGPQNFAAMVRVDGDITIIWS